MPESDLEILKKFIILPKNQQSIIITKIKDINPEIPWKKINEITEETEYDLQEVTDFFDLIVSLYLNYYKFGKSKEEFIREVVVNSIKARKVDIEFGENENLLINELLDFHDTFGILSKVTSLKSENPNNFIDAQIISDIRQLFYQDISRFPDYALIKHSLRLLYLEGSKIKKKFITLNKENLYELKRIIERAIDKDKTIREECEKKGMKILQEIDWDEYV